MAATYEVTLVAVTPAASGLPTYTELCGLKWEKLLLRDELSGTGMIMVDVETRTIESVGQARLLDLTKTPCELWVRRTTNTTTTSIVNAGVVTGVAIKGETTTITAPGLLTYLAYWLRDTDYTANSLDQATIVQQLCDQWQAQTYGNDGIITTGLSATGVLRQLNLFGIDGKYILPTIITMGGRNNGFDLTVDPATRKLTMWSPRKGNDLTGSVFIDKRSITAPDVSWTVAPGTVGSEVFGSSSSAQGSTISSIATNTALRATFGRSYVTRSYTDISDVTTLADYTNRTATDMGTQLYTLSPTLIPVGFSYGDFTPGDLITYDFDAGLGRQTFPVRVASIETTLDSGREQFRVGML